MERITQFADILLPLPLGGLFTYRIPHEFDKKISFGYRAIVPFGRNRLYSGLVIKVHENVPNVLNPKYIIDIIDTIPVVTPQQYKLWEWISKYYMCTLGEVMSAAMPSALKLTSETNIQLSPNFDGDVTELSEKERTIVESLFYTKSLVINEIEKIVSVKKSLPLIKTLIEKGIVITDEEIRNPYKPKFESYLTLAAEFQKEEAFFELIESLEKKKKNISSVNLLLSFYLLLKKVTDCENIDYSKSIPKKKLLNSGKISQSSLKSLIAKNILLQQEVKISRLTDASISCFAEEIILSEAQNTAFESINSQFKLHPTVLFHGITGSGKTEIYIKLIQQVLDKGKQVLYLLPEIALTTQIVNRLRKYFGNKVGVYHSKFNEFEKVEIWDKIARYNTENKYQLILGARSALLLPFSNLGLIIVDEEHDTSYKQTNVAPLYNARDGAIILSSFHNAQTVLGSATPSIESYYNAKTGKFGLVKLLVRYSGSVLPEIWLVDINECKRHKKINGNYSHFLIDHINSAIERKEQVIIFQNRRGYSLRMFCNSCQSIPTCIYCDVSLTYHKKSDLLKCHYCGYAIPVPHSCPMCMSSDIEMKGFGTEQVEESMQSYFPNARICRMDMDTTRSKNSYRQLISDFENHDTDILVGTQMVTKGLDFDNVTVVGIANADAIISYPDFRSFERAFQLLAQVSGRAGRKNKPGKVIIQSYNPKHPVLSYIVANDYSAMYNSQIAERQAFNYPPFYRLIKITLKHKEESVVNEASKVLAEQFRVVFPKKILGPEFPIVSKIQNLFLKDIFVKLPKNNLLDANKQQLKSIIDNFYKNAKFKSVKVIINVDV